MNKSKRINAASAVGFLPAKVAALAAETYRAGEKLYQVINYRYNARLATVITTRYSTEEILEEIEGSISSRLIDPKISVPFNIMAPDYRGDETATRKTKPYRRGKRERY